MKYLILLLFPLSVFAQKNMDSILAESLEFQKEMNSNYGDTAHSPLEPEDLKDFRSLPFFEIDSSYYVIAKFEKAKKEKSIKFKTSTDRRPIYNVYGTVYFTINGNEFSLKVYQSEKLKSNEEFKDYLFLPFTDLTNGVESYGGGRYIDLTIPDGNTMVINFNKAYNPYCAYSHRYSCPVVPKENFLDTEIKAGVMSPKSH